MKIVLYLFQDIYFLLPIIFNYNYMRKVKISSPTLALNNTTLVYQSMPQMIKLSFVEAVNFESKFSSFDEMLRNYGYNRKINENDPYTGYCAVYHHAHGQSVLYLTEALQKITTSSIKDALGNIFSFNHGTAFWLTSGRSVYNFRDCQFGQLLEMLKAADALDTRKFDTTLKEKLIDGVVNGHEIELSETEFTVLGAYFKNAFTEICTEV